MLDSMLLEVRRVSHSEDLLIAGDYVFISARPPIVVTESIPLDAPRGFFKRLWWGWFGAKCVVKKTEEEVWAAHDVIMMVCPVCRQPLATKRESIPSYPSNRLRDLLARNPTVRLRTGALLPF